MQEALEEERKQAAKDRQKLLEQISTLVNQQAEAQEARLADRVTQIEKGLAMSNTSLEDTILRYDQDMSAWDEQEGQLLEETKQCRDQLRDKLDDDWALASKHSSSIQDAATSVHAQTLRSVSERLCDFDAQMEALDSFVTSAKSENATQYETHLQSLQVLSRMVEQSSNSILDQFKGMSDHVRNLGEETELYTSNLCNDIEPLESRLCRPLTNLRHDLSKIALQEYQPTGATPRKVLYHYPITLPRTEAHNLISRADETSQPAKERSAEERGDNRKPDYIVPSPEPGGTDKICTSNPGKSHLGLILHEVNPNIATTSVPAEQTTPLLRRSTRSSRGIKKPRVMLDGRENLPRSGIARGISGGNN